MAFNFCEEIAHTLPGMDVFRNLPGEDVFRKIDNDLGWHLLHTSMVYDKSSPHYRVLRLAGFPCHIPDGM
jgi:hypothetical protein